MSRDWRTANERSAYFRRVLAMVEGSPKRTLSDVGAELGLSAERVRQIANEARLHKDVPEVNTPTDERSLTDG